MGLVCLCVYGGETLGNSVHDELSVFAKTTMRKMLAAMALSMSVSVDGDSGYVDIRMLTWSREATLQRRRLFAGQACANAIPSTLSDLQSKGYTEIRTIGIGSTNKTRSAKTSVTANPTSRGFSLLQYSWTS